MLTKPSISPNSRLFIVVRADLPPGLRASQICHAFRQFGEQHPELEREWFLVSNNIVLKEVPDEQALDNLIDMAREKGLPYACFLEPDLSGSLTAVALGPRAKNQLARLPLAFTEATSSSG